MKKIIVSLSIIAAVAAIAIGATTAYFSDTETSTGNTFTAGAIDLTIDNESYVTDSNGVLVASEETSWTLDNLTNQLFFNFSDLKPGDIGEDTISLHVDSNDAWLCAAFEITDDSDQSCTEPELEVDTNCTEPSGEGELADKLEFAFWADDGDNVYETGEYIFLEGTLDDLKNGKIALADSTRNVWVQQGQPGPLPNNTTKYIGKAWCFGDLGMTQLSQETTGPLTRPSSATCNGANVNNAPQTDRVMGNIQFYAEQARNNPNFTCASWSPNFTGLTRTLLLENKDTSWDVIDETGGTPEIQGFLTYKTASDNFDFTLDYYGLAAATSYSLIYYADKQDRFDDWGGDPLGKVIKTFTSDGDGIGTETGNVELGMDLPHYDDWNGSGAANYCDDANGFDDYNTCRGAKIWLVLTNDLTSGPNIPLVSWNPVSYLFETDLINYNDTSN